MTDPSWPSTVKARRGNGHQSPPLDGDPILPEKAALPFIAPKDIDLHDDNGYRLLALERPERHLFIGKAFTEVLTDFVGRGLLNTAQIDFLTQTFHKVVEEGLATRVAAAINEGRLRSLKWKTTGIVTNFRRENSLSSFSVRNAKLSTQGLALRSKRLQLFLSSESRTRAFGARQSKLSDQTSPNVRLMSLLNSVSSTRPVAHYTSRTVDVLPKSSSRSMYSQRQLPAKVFSRNRGSGTGGESTVDPSSRISSASAASRSVKKQISSKQQ